jgi:hypothetical protein
LVIHWRGKGFAEPLPTVAVSSDRLTAKSILAFAHKVILDWTELLLHITRKYMMVSKEVKESPLVEAATTARVQLQGKKTGRESQGARSQDELFGGKPPIAK